jgi:hypothetical protein
MADDDALEIGFQVSFGGRTVLDLPTRAASAVSLDGGPAPSHLGHGRHHLTVTAPVIAQPAAWPPERTIYLHRGRNPVARPADQLCSLPC